MNIVDMGQHPYPRDLRGYADTPPEQCWPNGARLALNFVLNYEEGAENTLLNGDTQSENYIHEIPATTPLFRQRDVNAESVYDYGARVGVWRLLRIFEQAQIPVTVFAVGHALALNPRVGRAFATAGHEVASHHWRWKNYIDVDPSVEKEHIQRSIEVITELTGTAPVGWYSGRGSLHSRELAAAAGFKYDSDAYDDELPHWQLVNDKPQLIIPYTLDVNDFRFSLPSGYATGADFEQHMRDTFDVLYSESAQTPRMMSVGLHPRMAGRPGRARALQRFIAYVKEVDGVWICTRAQIAEHWYRSMPPANLRSAMP
ncbi:polysaccharide deacetylase family protein [Rhodococcus sp. ACT016]|uniref:polysaccharide deacetylase family protein n=1 Tax=Rhodococcus sp. ACT016 TaxID=3134808 RepID=UPI003D27E1E1